MWPRMRKKVHLELAAASIQNLSKKLRKPMKETSRESKPFEV